MSIWTRFLNVFRQASLDREFEDELGFHLEQRIARIAKEGMPQEDVQAEALRRFGNTSRIKGEMQEVRVMKTSMAIALTCFVLAVGVGVFVSLRLAGSSALGKTSPDQAGTPVVPTNRRITNESVVVARDQAWRVYATEHFDIYYQAAGPRVDAVALEAESAYARIGINTNYQLGIRMPLILVPSDSDLPRSRVQAYELVLASGAPVEPAQILLSEETLAQRPYAVAHELAHAFLLELLPQPEDYATWVAESFADHQSGVWEPAALAEVRGSVTGGRVPAIESLTVSDRHSGHAVFDYIASEYGADGIQQYLAALNRRPPSGGEAIREAFAVSTNEFNRGFQAYAMSRSWN